MQLIAHLSDLHFGQSNPEMTAAVHDQLEKLQPELVVVSGDLTERARRGEFLQARDFLSSLPGRKLAVSGNHDVSHWSMFGPLTNPMRRFRRWVEADPAPCYHNAGMLVLGVNPARHDTDQIHLTAAEAESVRKRLCSFKEPLFKIVAIHHPFDLRECYAQRELVGAARLTLEKLASCGADILLTGHFHHGHASGSVSRYQIPGRSTLVVQAGTATSLRSGSQPNSFNLIRLEPPLIQVEVLGWDPRLATFATLTSNTFKRTPGSGFQMETSFPH